MQEQIIFLARTFGIISPLIITRIVPIRMMQNIIYLTHTNTNTHIATATKLGTMKNDAKGDLVAQEYGLLTANLYRRGSD